MHKSKVNWISTLHIYSFMYKSIYIYTIFSRYMSLITLVIGIKKKE